jgi:hypothetical protein
VIAERLFDAHGQRHDSQRIPGVDLLALQVPAKLAGIE